MRYSKKTLENGICPVCKNNGLQKFDWYHNCEVIYKHTFKYDQWNNDPVEVQVGEDYPYITEYKCDLCRITFHPDNDSFIGES